MIAAVRKIGPYHGHGGTSFAGRDALRDAVNSNAEFAQSLKYLAKAYIHGGVRTTKHRYIIVRRQPMYQSRGPHQVQDKDQQYSRCREFFQITPIRQ